MRSWSSLLAEEAGAADEAVLRRFVEASLRADIIALVNSASGETELAETVTSELCKAFEAEIAFVLVSRAPGSPPEVIASAGLAAPRVGGAAATHDESAGAALKDARCLAALDATRVESHVGDDLLGRGARRLALAPFRGSLGGRVVVGVARRYGEDFDAAELALLEAVTEGVGHALERAWLASDRELHAGRQAALARAARMLNASLELDEVIQTLAREVRVAFAADATLVLLAGDGAGLTVAAADGLADTFAGLRIDQGAGPAGAVLATGAPQLSAAYQEAGHEPASTPGGDPIEAAIAVPLARSGAADGVLEVIYLSPHALGDSDVELLSAFAELAGGACRNAEQHAAARRAASVDALTGCLNHATFQTRLREEVSRAERGGEPFTLAVLDLDGFRVVNERHGYLTGDTVLRGVGELLRATVRLHDQVARLGGDEFALVLPATDAATARMVVDRSLDALAAAPLPGGGIVTFKAGIATWQLGDQATALIERADAAMRDRKRVPEEVPEHLPVTTGYGASRRRRAPGRRTQRLAMVAEIGARLTRQLDPQIIAETAVADARSALGYERCAIVAQEARGPRRVAAAGWPADDLDARIDEQGPVVRSLRERRLVLVKDGDRDPAWAGRLPEGVRSLLVAPLYAGSELWGAMEVVAPAPDAFDQSDAQLLSTLADHIGAALRTAELYHELELLYVGTASALAAALEAKDNYTADHAASIAELAVEVGREIGLNRVALRDLRYGAIFHDIGKIAIPDAILHKAGPLNEAEFEIVKRHPITGEQILAPVPFLHDVRRIVRHDHERWDGDGYPDGLSGEDIPIGARIVLVVDAYHAMISDRPYRQGMSPADARAELRAHAGSQFDPVVVTAFLDVQERRRAADRPPGGAVSSGR